jgi:hypothetical protein
MSTDNLLPYTDAELAQIKRDLDQKSRALRRKVSELGIFEHLVTANNDVKFKRPKASEENIRQQAVNDLLNGKPFMLRITSASAFEADNYYSPETRRWEGPLEEPKAGASIKYRGKQTAVICAVLMNQFDDPAYSEVYVDVLVN